MLRHHSLGPAELAALMGAWHPRTIAAEPRRRWIVALDMAAAEDDGEHDADHGAMSDREGKGSRP